MPIRTISRGLAWTLAALSVPLLAYGAASMGRGTVSRPPEKETTMKTTGQTPRYSKSAYDITHLDAQTIETLARDLTDEQRRIILDSGTERPFCGTLLDNKKDGFYACRLCKLPLFSSASKFTSGTGWPSFFQPFDAAHVATREDGSHGMTRVEILCARCSGHLGHVFPDGPEPTGQRYCVNSESLEFYEQGDELPEMARPVKTETAYFAGGCFWGIEDRFQKQAGVIDAVSGYQGGDDSGEPSYREVCTGKTGHAESVRVVYDPGVISYSDLLAWFFRIHDPTQGNRQGPDIGTQYRSVIFATSDEQFEQAQRFLEKEQRVGRWSSRPITTELRRAADARFYPAEEGHQDYYQKNGGTCYTPIYEEWDG